MKSKRILAALFGFLVTTAVLPGVALADGTRYWVGDAPITTSDDAGGSGWTWVVDGNGGGTLTLNDAAIRGADAESGDLSAVYLPGGSTVDLQGDSTLFGGSVSINDTTRMSISTGLSCNGTLTITGSGSLTAAGGSTYTTDTSDNAETYSYGIVADSDAGAISDIVFDNGFTGGVCAVGGYSLESCGVLSSNGTVSVQGEGSVTAVGGKARAISAGISAGGVGISGKAHVTATGGEATEAGGSSYGLASGDMVQVGAAAMITATGGTAAGESAGISFLNAREDILRLSGGAQVTAVGGQARNISCGVLTRSTSCSVDIVDGSTLTAVGGAATDSSYGMRISQASSATSISVVVDSGALVAKSDQATISRGLSVNADSVASSPDVLLSYGNSIDTDSVIVAYAGAGGTAVENFSTIPAGQLVGSASGRYAVYGKGIYMEPNHVFDTAQDVAPAAPFVIIDANGGGTVGIAGYALKTGADTTNMNLSGTSVLIAGDVDDPDRGGDLSGALYVNGTSLALDGGGTLVCLGGTSDVSCGVYGNVGNPQTRGVTVTVGQSESASTPTLVGVCGCESRSSQGIYIDGALTSSGRICAVGGGGAPNCGVASAFLTLQAGALSAIGGQSTGESYGCQTSTTNDSMQVSNASVAAIGGSSGSGNAYVSCGLSSGPLTVSGGKLQAVGGSSSSGPSYGLRCSKSLEVSAGSTSGVGGYGGVGSMGVFIIGGGTSSVGGGGATGAGLCGIGGVAAGSASISAGLRVNPTSWGDATLTVEDTGLFTAFGGKSTASTSGSYGANLYTDAKLVFKSPAVALSGNTLAVGGGVTGSVTLDAVVTKAGADATGKNAALVAGTPDYSAYKYVRTLRALAVVGAQAQDKVYGDSFETTVTYSSVSGIVSGDDVTVEASGSFADKNVGTGKSVTATYALGGADAWKYVAPSTDGTLQANITPKPLTIKDVVATNRQYDGSTGVEVTGGTLEGLAGSDNLQLDATGALGAMADASAGTAKPVTVSGYDVTGDTATKNNYTITQPAGVTVDIAQFTPAISAPPTAGSISCGQALSASTLNGGAVTGVDGGALPGSFTWTDPGFTPTSAGTYSYSVTFTPTDAVNYNAAVCDVSIVVQAARPDEPQPTPDPSSTPANTMASTGDNVQTLPWVVAAIVAIAVVVVAAVKPHRSR